MRVSEGQEADDPAAVLLHARMYVYIAVHPTLLIVCALVTTVLCYGEYD